MVNFFAKIKVVFLLIAIFILYSCNLANSADISTSNNSSNNSSDNKNNSVSISIVASLPAVNFSGYYQERSIVTINASAIGSLNSTTSCLITVSQKANSVLTYIDVDVINGCGEKTIAFVNGAGIYKIKLIATDANSKTAEAQTFAIVVPETINAAPILAANFSATPSASVGSGFDIALDATTSTKGETGDIATYTWEIRKKENDAQPALISTIGPLNSPITNTVVASDGIYVVKLTIVDNGSKTASTSKTFTVSTAGPTLIADFSITIPAGVAPLNIQVDASSSTVASIDHYAWDLYNSESITSSIYHVETESKLANIPVVIAGIYLIRLRVIDALGNEHEVTRSLQVS